MAEGNVELFNLALSACGSGGKVSVVDERSREAAECRLWYPRIRANVISSAPWPSVRKYRRLASLGVQAETWVEGSPDPNFSHAYSVPDDLIQPYHLQTYQPFAYNLINGVRAISTNDPAALLFYNSLQTDVSLWEEGLFLAVVYSLAVHIARPITGRESTIQTNASLANGIVEEARLNAANSEDQVVESLPDWIQARGFANTGVEKFIYPYSTLNTRTGA